MNTRLHNQLESITVAILSCRSADFIFFLLCLGQGLIRFVPIVESWIEVIPGGQPLWGGFLPYLDINYFDEGFVRRGFIGTVAHILGVKPSISAVRAFYAIGVLAATGVLTALAWTSTQSLAALQRVLLLAMLAASPAVFSHWAWDAGRLDSWVVAFVVLGVIAAQGSRLLLSALAFAIAGLVHESAFVIFSPLFLAIGVERLRQAPCDLRQIARLATAGTIVGGVFLAVLLLGDADPRAFQMNVRRFGSLHPYDIGDPLFPWTATVGTQFHWTICLFKEEPISLLSTGIALVFLLLHSIALFGGLGRRCLGLALMPVASAVLMTSMVLDNSRYISLAAISVWLYLFVILRSDVPKLLPLRRALLIILLCFYALGPLSVGAGFGSVNRIVLKFFGSLNRVRAMVVCAP